MENKKHCSRRYTLDNNTKQQLKFNINTYKNFVNLFKFYIDFAISIKYNIPKINQIRDYLESIEIPNIIERKLRRRKYRNTYQNVKKDKNISSIKRTLKIFDIVFPKRHIYKLKFLCNYIYTAKNTKQYTTIYSEIEKLKDLVPLRNYFHILNCEITYNVFCYNGQ